MDKRPEGGPTSRPRPVGRGTAAAQRTAWRTRHARSERVKEERVANKGRDLPRNKVLAAKRLGLKNENATTDTSGATGDPQAEVGYLNLRKLRLAKVDISELTGEAFPKRPED